MANIDSGEARRISIAMCTFNGARFLPEQLQSFLVQTLLPCELIVCDDGSDDSTQDILEQFARSSPFPVRITCNRERLGVVRNFDQAIGLCNGEFIALADQDDVWSPVKLERLAQALDVSGVTAAFSDAEVVDAALSSLGYTMWQRLNFDRDERRRIEDGDALGVLLKHYVVTGAALAFRADLRSLIQPIPVVWPHDAWIAVVAAAVGDIRPMSDPLTRYRQHGGNQVGGLKKRLLQQIDDAFKLDRKQYYRDEITRWRMLNDRLPLTLPNARKKIEEKLHHLEMRADLPAARWRRIPGIWRGVTSGAYLRFARNWGSIALDLLVR